jgi:CheY-like chemotaxis protein
MLRTVFENTLAEVKACAGAVEALEVLQEWKADALISDLDMPEVDGYALMEKVRNLEKDRGKHIVAIALTAHVQVEDRKRALATGFDAFMPKPVAPNELLAALSDRL